MTNDDHATLIEIKDRLIELHAAESAAKEASDWARCQQLQAEIAFADTKRVEVLRRTEPEDGRNSRG
jgi:hypothetical protein